MFRLRVVFSSSWVEMSGTYHPTTQRHIPEEQMPQVRSLAY
jgi:hypothetical protein